MKNISYLKIILAVSSGIILIIIFLVIQGKYSLFEFDKKNENEISLGKCLFKIETVNDNESRERGLSGREKLCYNCGMLFVFPEAQRYGFWMKDMLFSLDIIWIKDGKVVEVMENVSKDSRETFFSKVEVDKVLEINATEARSCDIKIGDRIK